MKINCLASGCAQSFKTNESENVLYTHMSSLQDGQHLVATTFLEQRSCINCEHKFGWTNANELFDHMVARDYEDGNRVRTSEMRAFVKVVRGGRVDENIERVQEAIAIRLAQEFYDEANAELDEGAVQAMRENMTAHKRDSPPLKPGKGYNSNVIDRTYLIALHDAISPRAPIKGYTTEKNPDVVTVYDYEPTIDSNKVFEYCFVPQGQSTEFNDKITKFVARMRKLYNDGTI